MLAVRSGRLCAAVLVAVVLACMCSISVAQLGAPSTQGVYGGRVLSMAAVALNSTTTRLFVTTESANSAFYADVYNTTGTVSLPLEGTSNRFAVVPAMDSVAGFGSATFTYGADKTTAQMFFTVNTALKAWNWNTNTINTVFTDGVTSVTLYNNTLFVLRNAGGSLNLHYGSPAAGATLSSVTVTTVGAGVSIQGTTLVVNPTDFKPYVAVGLQSGGVATAPALLVASSTYWALSGSTTFSAITTTSVASCGSGAVFNIGPDGRLFFGVTNGSDVTGNTQKAVVYSDSPYTSWTCVPTGIAGIGGPNVAVGPLVGGSYHVYFATAVSNNRGASGSWSALAQIKLGTNPNDGYVQVDPNWASVVYMTTDLGLGASTNYGTTLNDICNGIEAVQVNDFVMNSGKTIGWMAGKAGLRKVQNITGTPIWGAAKWPDGAGFQAVAMDETDSSGNTVWASNSRLYYTTTAYASQSTVYTIDTSSSDFCYRSYISSIVTHPTDANVLFFGIRSPEVTGCDNTPGYVYMSTNAKASSPTFSRVNVGGINLEVQDLLFVPSSSTDGKLYVCCEYVSAGTASSGWVKTITKSGASTTFNNEMRSSSTGTLITNFGCHNLAKSTAGDIYAAGQTSTGAPAAYVQYSGATTWSPLPTAGLPTGTTTGVDALAVGTDSAGRSFPLVAIQNTVYYLNGSTWTSAYTYPTGQLVRVMFWDDLVVGTGTGLSSFRGFSANVVVNNFSAGAAVVPSPLLMVLATLLALVMAVWMHH